MTSTTNNSRITPIGGELDISLEDFLKPELNVGLTSGDKKSSLYLDTGRSAIYVALLNILERGGKREAWLPRYCCPSVELPFSKLGFKLNYYSTGCDLNTPCGLPEKLTGETFFFIHYFGKRNQALQKYLGVMKEQYSFFVIEDCVQALLTSDLGNYDYVVYSFRKFLPQPDGALLSYRFPLVECKLAPADEAFVSRKLIGKLIRFHSKNTLFLDLFAFAEKMIDEFSEPREISYLSKYLLTRANAEEISEKRRSNFFHLIKAIKQHSYDEELFRPLFTSLKPGETPLGLPVVINPAFRDRLRAHLANKRIFCPIHWPLEIEKDHFWRNELLLSHSLLTLPLDQRLDCPSLNYLLEKVTEFFNEAGVNN